MFRRLTREPMVHFAGLAVLIFAAYYALSPRQDAPAQDRIVVSSGRIEQIAALFAATWQRPPREAELKGLIDDYVKEEIYVREALALGLDSGDSVVRRRLMQKMQMLGEAVTQASPPSEAELQAYLAAHPEQFAIAPRIGFEQVFLDPLRHGDQVTGAAAVMLAQLNASPAPDAMTLGDRASLLPPAMPPASPAEIADLFGADFAQALVALPTDTWSGPVMSGFGLHLVRVTAHQPGRPATLAEVRDAVVREWANSRNRAAEKAQLDALLRRYQVTIEAAPPAVTP